MYITFYIYIYIYIYISVYCFSIDRNVSENEQDLHYMMLWWKGILHFCCIFVVLWQIV